MSSSAPNAAPSTIGHTMSTEEIVAILGDHGCPDVTDRLDVSTSSMYPIASGGFGDVYRVKMYDSAEVAVKTGRMYVKSTVEAKKQLKRAARELYTWSRCDHPNVLKLLGLAVFREQIGMVSLWMENGCLPVYLDQNPSADRCKLLAGISEALAYLHANHIVHGDLKGLNVLISSEGVPVLTDFGHAVLRSQSLQFTATASNVAFSFRWTAPELVQSGTRNEESDVYALGMTILETITGEVPYADKSEHAVMLSVWQRELPKRPAAIPINKGQGDVLWMILTKCWSNDPTQRPSAADVVEVVKSLSDEGLRGPDQVLLEGSADTTRLDNQTNLEKVDLLHLSTSNTGHEALVEVMELSINQSDESETSLPENEREAVANLFNFLENRTTTDFFSGSPLSALTILSFSDNVELQRSAAIAFAEITENEVCQVGRETIDPILFLLSSNDTWVQRASGTALGNLATNTENKTLIVKLGGLEPLIHQMLGSDVEVQCNATRCVINLATHDENRTMIVKSGALVPLTRLAHSEDIRVQRHATGALLNMTYFDEDRQQLVDAGGIPVLVDLLESPDTDTQYYCTTALSNIAVDADNRKKLTASEPELVQSLIALMDSPSLKVQYQAAVTIRNLALDENYQLEIVRSGGLQPLLRLLHSNSLLLILSSAACVRNLAIHPLNGPLIIEAGYLDPLIDLQRFEKNQGVRCNAISVLRKLGLIVRTTRDGSLHLELSRR